MCVCVCVIEYRILLSSFSNQLSRAFSPFCRGKQAWVCAGRPAGLPPCLLACLPACLPPSSFMFSLSVSAEEGSLQKCAAHFSLSLSVRRRRGFACISRGRQLPPRKYVRILHTSNTPYMY